MKKVLVTICAMAAVLACTKTEVTFDEPGEISFAPVSKYATKADDAPAFDQDFYVYAYTTEGTPYFTNVLFQDNTTAGVYLGSTPQYWPNEKALKFAGVTATGATNNVNVSMSAWGEMTVEDYVQPLPSATETKDLMYFFDEGTDGDDAGDTPDGYKKPTTNEVNVTPVMHHACSKLSFNVAVQSNLVGYWNDIKIHTVTIESLQNKGTVTFTENPLGVAWTNTSNAVDSDSDMTIFNNSTGVGISASATSLATSETIVIPQTPFDISVTYSYTTAASGTTRITENVSDVSLQYNGTNAWAPGVHYTYNLTIGADQIKIAPKAEDWTTGSGSGLSQDVK